MTGSILTKTAAVMCVAARNLWVYRADVLLRGMFYVLIILIFIQLWSVALPGKTRVAGLGREDLVWYLVFTEAIMLALPRFEETISDEVKSGEIAYRLLRPMHYLWFHMAHYLGEACVQVALNLTLGAAVAWMVIGPAPTELNGVPALVLVAIGGLVLSYWISASIALAAFWIEDTKPFFWIYHKMLFTVGGLLIPNDLMPAWLRSIADALPFASILYAPARLAVAWDTGLFIRTVATQALWILLLFSVARATFRWGLRSLSVQGG